MSLALRTPALTVGAVVLSVGSAALLLVADIRPAGSSGQLALDSAAATISLFLAYLVYGRFRLSRLLRDLLLCVTLLVLGGGNLVLSVAPVVLGDPSGRLSAAGVATGLVAGLLFAAAAWAPRSRVVHGRSPLVALAPAAVILGGASVLRSSISSTPGLGAADTFGATQDVVASSAQVVAALAFLVAAVGWARAAAHVDRMAASLAVGAVFGGASRVAFAVADDATSTWVTVGTLLRVLFYVALVAAATREVRDYWQRVADVAVLEERRRLARELHDGLAQELAFVVTQTRALREQSTNRRAQLIVGAAERALDESRRAIAALTRSLDEPLEVSLGQAVEEVANRFQTRVRFQLAPGVTVPAPTREALLRVAREAVSNAGRHGQADNVLVALSNGDGVTLRVTDDGCGFDPAELDPRSGRLGLVSMRERAEALGGSLRITSQPSGGTTVEVNLP